MADGTNLRTMTIALAAFRAFIGALLVGMPWIVGNGLDGYGATCVGLGVAVIAAAVQMHRAPWLRWVQAALAFAVFFAPFAFAFDDISDKEIYCEVLIGHMLLISAIVTPKLFAQETSERTSASDDSRSDASKTSSVSTPSN
ncbi:MAG TPA: hypothetical protein VF997_09400 [Polyangia bacterium]